MKKQALLSAVETAKNETKTALQTVYDALNQGQQKKIVKDEKVKELFDRYGVEYSD
jgi:Fe2+ or Zn2+ uptake regulation protein